MALGRDREIATLVSGLRRAQSGAGSVLVLRGAAGIGKSTLLAEAQRVAVEEGMAVLACRGVRAESNVPFAALHQLLRPILASLPALPRDQGNLLRAALGLDESLVADLYRVALAALELLATVAVDTPVLLLVDDAHWVDRPSGEVLAFVGRRLGAEPVAMLIAIRQGAEGPLNSGDFPELVISSLDDAAAELLLDQTAPDLGGKARRRVLKVAAGNPLALIELPAVPVASGLLPNSVPVGELLERSFVARIAELPRPTWFLLLAAALDPTGTVEELRQAAGAVMGGAVELADLQPAINAHLVHLEMSGVGFCHPLLASAIAQHASLDDRVRMHIALASTLTQDQDRRVWHLAAAAMGPDNEVADALVELAERAARRGALAVSVAALDRASTLATDDSRRAELLSRASLYSLEAGQSDCALELAARAEKGCLGVSDRARMLIVAREVHPGADVDQRAVPELVEAAQELRAAGDRDLAASLLWTAASHCWWTSADEATRRTVVIETEILALAVDDPRRVAILSYTMSSAPRSALWRDLVRIAPGPGDLAGLRFVASAAENLGDHALAARTLVAAAMVARQQGRLGVVTRLQALQAWASLWSGNLDRVVMTAGETDRLTSELDQPLWQGAARLEQAIASGLQGSFTGAKDRIRATLATDALRDVRLFHAMALYGLSVAALGVGQYQEAYDLLRRIIDPDDESSHYGARQWVIADLAEAAIGAGQLEKCTEVLAGLRDEFRTYPVPAVHHAVVFADALVAPEGSARDRFADALGTDAGGSELARARVHLAYGMWLRRQRQTRQAREVLQEANQAFTELGMGGFAYRVARELRAAGGGDGPAYVDVPKLTPQERQIAQLAADGLSNRQIGEQLFLSHRTVGSHLYHLFPKLGITNRSQLATALRSGRAA